MRGKVAPEEIGLGEAAALLKVSEKTVRNYIKLRKIQAVKVAKNWYVDRVSLTSFMATQIPDLLSAEIPTSQQGPVPAANAAGRVAPPVANDGAAVHNLACYRLFLAAVEQFTWDQEESGLQQFLNSKCRDVIAHLGSGYYAFGHAKRSHYEVARAGIGGMISVLAAEPALYQRHQKAAKFLERDVLPAFAALMRKLEQRGSDPRRKSGGSAQGSGQVP